MSRQRLVDQYINGVLRGVKTNNNTLSNIYSSMYVEDTQQELAGIDGGDAEETVAVFYVDKHSLTEDVVAQFRAIGGEGPVHIPTSYFDKIERRFRGKTIERLAHQWLKASTKGGKVDNLAYESLLNKLFDTDIKGAEDLVEFKDIIEWCSGNESNFQGVDVVHQLLSENTIQSINFSDAFSDIVSYFVSGDPNDFLYRTWNITEQAKGVGVGKGEIAISLLSRGFKGEPGDIKFENNSDGVQLDVEVKGEGGRPGKSNYTHGFRKKAIKLLPDNIVLDRSSIEDVQQGLHGSSLNIKLKVVKDWFEDTLRVYYMKGHETVMNSKGQDIIEQFTNRLDQIANESSGKDVESIVSDILGAYEPVQEMMNNFNAATGKKLKLPANISSVLFGKGTGGLALYIMTGHQYKSVSFLKDLNWRAAVTFFFTFVARQSEMTEGQVAEALVETRTDKLNDNLAQALKSAIESLLLSEGVGIVYDKDTLGKLIAAIQFTSYCSYDGFNRALFINDHSLNARSVPTDPNDPAMTLDNLYQEFVTNGYIISMNVDSRSKGVQVTYNG